MPHIIIEYSANVGAHHDVQALVDVVHAAALDHGLPPLAGLRTRAAERTAYRVADGSVEYAFIAINAHIGPGRDADAKTTFIAQVLDAAEAQVARESQAEAPLVIAWSMEVTEIDAQFRVNRNYIRERMEKSG